LNADLMNLNNNEAICYPKGKSAKPTHPSVLPSFRCFPLITVLAGGIKKNNTLLDNATQFTFQTMVLDIPHHLRCFSLGRSGLVIVSLNME